MTQLQNHAEEEKDEVHARHREMQRDELCGLQISRRNYICAFLSPPAPADFIALHALPLSPTLVMTALCGAENVRDIAGD